MNPDDLRRLFPNASRSVLEANAEVPNAQPPKQAPALDQDSEGKARSTGRPHVCFTLCRVQLLDVDAKYSSIKDLLDALQHCGAIRGDREEEITLEVRQEKVRGFKDEKTEIEITYP